MTHKTLNDMAIEISKLLNDSYHLDPEYNFTRWSKSELIEYCRDAIGMLVMLHPKKFTECTTVPLVPGRIQKLPRDCTILTKVLNTQTDLGVVPSTTNKVDSRLGDAFNTACTESANPKDYKIDNFDLEETSDSIFYVTPPVPVTEHPIMATVICVSSPDVSDGKFEPYKWMHNLIIEWALYRAYSSEDESTASDSNAKGHLEHFYAILRNYINAEDKMMLQKDLVPNATTR